MLFELCLATIGVAFFSVCGFGCTHFLYLGGILWVTERGTNTDVEWDIVPKKQGEWQKVAIARALITKPAIMALMIDCPEVWTFVDLEIINLSQIFWALFL